MRFGSETEFGILGGWTLARAQKIQEAVERERHLPAVQGSGVYLTGGGRSYVDQGRQNEYATPETEDPAELVVRELAGRRLLQRCAAKQGLRLVCSNVDYATGHAWGTHENYECAKPLAPDARGRLYTHLVTRLVFSGAGGIDPQHPGARLVLSPRAGLIEVSFGRQGRAVRGLVFAKPFHYSAGYRLHVFSGESLLSQHANYLKYATTALVVGLLDAGHQIGPGPFAASPLRALRRVNRDIALCTRLELADGRRRTALEIQARLLDDVAARLTELPAWAGTAVERWRQMLEALADGRTEAAQRLDWKAYAAAACDLAEAYRLPPDYWRALNRRVASPRRDGLSRFEQRRLLEFRAACAELYVRMHLVGPGSLFAWLRRRGVVADRLPEITDRRIARAVRSPPPGRARHRARLIRKWQGRADVRLSWDHWFDIEHARSRPLDEPAPPPAGSP